MTLLDTGYLIAIADRRDQLHRRAVHWAGVIEGELILTEYVLVEAVNHFSSAIDRERAFRLLDWVQTDPQVEIVWAGHELFAAGVRLHRARGDKNWSLTDCISFHIMKERGVRQALAYDIHFEQAGFEPLLRREPGV